MISTKNLSIIRDDMIASRERKSELLASQNDEMTIGASSLSKKDNVHGMDKSQSSRRHSPGSFLYLSSNSEGKISINGIVSNDVIIERRNSNGDAYSRRSSGEHVSRRTSGEHVSRRTSGEHASRRTSGEPSSRRSSGDHASRRSSGEPSSRRSSGDHASRRSSGDTWRPSVRDEFSRSVTWDHTGITTRRASTDSVNHNNDHHVPSDPKPKEGLIRQLSSPTKLDLGGDKNYGYVFGTLHSNANVEYTDPESQLNHRIAYRFEVEGIELFSAFAKGNDFYVMVRTEGEEEDISYTNVAVITKYNKRQFTIMTRSYNAGCIKFGRTRMFGGRSMCVSLFHDQEEEVEDVEEEEKTASSITETEPSQQQQQQVHKQNIKHNYHVQKWVTPADHPIYRPCPLNMKVVADEDNKEIVRFAKLVDDRYHLCFKHPMSALQAFALGLAQFHL